MNILFHRRKKINVCIYIYSIFNSNISPIQTVAPFLKAGVCVLGAKINDIKNSNLQYGLQTNPLV